MNPEALNDLLRENYAMIRSVCWRILNNESDAEDATQNAMISIARRIDTFDARSAITTWIYRIATNAALDELRRRRRRPTSTSDERFLKIVDSSSEQGFSAVDSADYLSAALDQIPEDFRVALVLRDVADLDYDEIGRILDIPGGTVRSRIARGRARLADIVGNPSPVTERHNAGRDSSEQDNPEQDNPEHRIDGPEAKNP